MDEARKKVDGTTLDSANIIVRARKDVLQPAVDKVFAVAVETGMTPDELEAVLILAWRRAMRKGVLTKRTEWTLC